MPARKTPSTTYVIQNLEKLYDPPRAFLIFSTPLELLIATVLSARCTDNQVNRVTPSLFRAHRSVQSFATVSQSDLEREIHSCGTFRMKAKNIRALSSIIIENFNGEVPRTMEELMSLPGVGRKTAAIVLYGAFGINDGIAVDTHVQRLALRLGLTKKRTPDKIALDLEGQVPRKKWGRINALLISHGRAVCTARGRKCGQCVFKTRCPSSLMSGGRDLAA